MINILDYLYKSKILNEAYIGKSNMTYILEAIINQYIKYYNGTQYNPYLENYLKALPSIRRYIKTRDNFI